MSWSNPYGKNALDCFVADAMGLFYVEFGVDHKFQNKKHKEVFNKIKNELQVFIEERVKIELKKRASEQS